MSKIIASAAIRGAHKIITRVEKKYGEVLQKYGPAQEIGFPDTAYYLPIIYGITGIPVKTLGDCQPVLRRCLAKDPAERWPSARAFAEALSQFQRGELARAQAAFARLVESAQATGVEDGPSRVYLAESIRLAAGPLPAGWDGCLEIFVK